MEKQKKHVPILSLKGTVWRDFFHESSFSKPLKITLGPFLFFSKIHGDICKSRFTTVNNNIDGKFATGVNNTGGNFSAGVNYTGGKFATGINDTDGKFCHRYSGVVDTGGKSASENIVCPFKTCHSLWVTRMRKRYALIRHIVCAPIPNILYAPSRPPDVQCCTHVCPDIRLFMCSDHKWRIPSTAFSWD